MNPHETLVFLFDVDNTLLDNDRLKRDLAERLQNLLGPERARIFWEIYEVVRGEEEYVDLPETVRRWSTRAADPETGAELDALLDNWNFRAYLYPDALEAISHLWTLGTVAILSDGDTVFQPRKILASGLQDAVHGNVLIYVHKEEELQSVFAAFPADQYVMIDDKPRILAALERESPTRFTTVLVLQGTYGVEHEFTPEPDYVIEHIGDLISFSRSDFLSTRREPDSASNRYQP